MSIENTTSLNWPSFPELENLYITSYHLGEEADYFTTKDGFIYEYKNNESSLALNIHNYDQFPYIFSDDLLGGLLSIISNNEFIYVSFTIQVPNGPQTLLVNEYSKDFTLLRNIITIDDFPELASDHVAFGGTLLFDKLGTLYLSVGDGGPQGFEDTDAQDLNSLQGKMLRLDVSTSKIEPEIIGYGLRNPWGISIDSNDRIFISVCGAQFVETVYLLDDLNPDTPPNFGWPIYHGTKRTPERNDPLIFEDITAPIYEYTNRPGCAIGTLFLEELELLLIADYFGTLRMLKQGKNGNWHVFHEYKHDNLIWGLGFDKKTKKIFIGPNSFELKILVEPVKPD
jgi:hypothetical protein